MMCAWFNGYNGAVVRVCGQRRSYSTEATKAATLSIKLQYCLAIIHASLV